MFRHVDHSAVLEHTHTRTSLINTHLEERGLQHVFRQRVCPGTY